MIHSFCEAGTLRFTLKGKASHSISFSLEEKSRKRPEVLDNPLSCQGREPFREICLFLFLWIICYMSGVFLDELVVESYKEVIWAHIILLGRVSIVYLVPFIEILNIRYLLYISFNNLNFKCIGINALKDSNWTLFIPSFVGWDAGKICCYEAFKYYLK